MKRERLTALLVAVGAIGTIAVLLPRPEVTVGELMDAGLDECRQVSIRCPVVKTTWPDGGNGADVMTLEGRLCDSDGGQFLVPLAYWDLHVSNWEACEVLP